MDEIPAPQRRGTMPEALMRQAEETAKLRGHTLGEWEPGDYWTDRRYANCTACGMNVVFTPRPPPNGTYIHGMAVAVDCDAKGDK